MKAIFGLCNEGLDIRNELEDAHASIEDYEVLWGKKKKVIMASRLKLVLMQVY